jgi:bifunctional non-homologous end joining protein LigD
VSTKRALRVGRREIEISNPDKALYPDDHLTKADVVAHYQAVADVMVPHLRGRPLTLRRFPDGIGRGGFFQKGASDHFPGWVRTADVPQRSGAAPVRHVVCDDAATLVYLANLACLEFHVGLSRVDDLERPDRFVVDLDPPDGVELGVLRAVVRRVRDLVARVGLEPFVQATGGKGFHVMAALDRSADFDEVRAFARDLARHLAERDPDRLTVEQRKNKRGDRIYLDVNRNAYGQTAVAAYSLRARPGAAVATPIDWPELGRTEPAGYHTDTVRRRLGRKRDPWAGLARRRGSAARAHRKLAKLADAGG